MSLLHTIESFLASIVMGLLVSISGLTSTAISHVTVPPQPVVINLTSSTTTPPTIATTSPKAEVSSTSATTTPKKKVATTVQATLKPSSPASPTPASIDSQKLNTITRLSLVNVLCITQTNGAFKPVSGSGVIIDSRGVVLTNAHIGQFFLLRDYPFQDNIQCVVRTGSPAQPLYTAQLLYLPPAWVTKNGAQLISNVPTGTGENDYAFLRISGTVSPAVTLPTSFPALAPYVGDAAIGEPTLLVAYPAGFLDGATIEMNLYASSAFAFVRQLFSFDNTSNVDLISIGGTIVSQSGSSGGATVRTQDGALIGIIATATLADTTSARDLRAITMGHINRSLGKFGKGSIAELLQGDLAAKAADFAATTGESERKQLFDILNNR